MDSEKRNEDVNPAQNELDLGFNQIEPITPKKVIKPEPSLFEKAKGFFSKKEKAQPTQFNVRREPTLGSPAMENQGQNLADMQTVEAQTTEVEPQAEAQIAVETAMTQSENSVSHSASEAQASSQEASVEAAPTHAEPVSENKSANLKNPENWAIMQKLPQKHRRLFIVLFVAVLLLLFFFWLKPSSDTVDSFQQQTGTNFPVEFQPIDQTQEPEPVEPTAPVDANLNISNTEASNVNTAPTTTPANNAEQKVEAVKPAQEPKVEQKAEPKVSSQPTDNKASTKTQEKNTALLEAEKARAERAKAEAAAKAEKARLAAEKAKAEKIAADKKLTQLAKEKAAEKKAPVVDAKADSQVAKGSKSLTVPAGVSLMQVFRENQLNISDVNAMTKAAGAGSVLSSLKAGERVQVAVAGGHVSELRLANGGRFIRQANGTYIYKK